VIEEDDFNGTWIMVNAQRVTVVACRQIIGDPRRWRSEDLHGAAFLYWDGKGNSTRNPTYDLNRRVSGFVQY
jgi:hypothetical protein